MPKNTLRFWEVGNEKNQRTIKVRDGKVPLAGAYSPDGKAFVYTEANGVIHLLRTDTYEPVYSWHSAGLHPLFLSNNTVATEHPFGYEIQLWDVEKRKLLRTLKSGFGIFSQIGIALAKLRPATAFSPDGTLMATARYHTLCVRDLRTGHELFPDSGHVGPIARVQFAHDGKTVICQGGEEVHAWDASTGTERRSMQIPWDGSIENIPCLSPDGNTWAGDEHQHDIGLWDSTSIIKRVRLHGDNGFAAFEFAPTGDILAAREYCSPTIRLFETGNGKPLGCLRSLNQMKFSVGLVSGLHCSAAQGLEFSPDGSRLAATLNGHSCEIWDARAQVLLRQVEFPDQLFRPPVCFTPDGCALARANEAGGVTLWEVASGRPRRHFAKSRTTSPEETAYKHLPLPDGREIGLIYEGSLSNMVFSPDGQLLCLGRNDRTITIWHVPSGRELVELRGHLGEVTSLAFSSDGKRLVSGSSDTTALIWDVSAILPKQPESSHELSEREIESCWTNLRDQDACKAFEAVCGLVCSSKTAVEYLRKNLLPDTNVDEAQVKRWISALGDQKFRVREQATRELEILGELAGPAMRQALEAKPDPEVRRRLAELLEKTELRADPTEVRLRALRAIEILENIGTREAIQVLRCLAAGNVLSLKTKVAHESILRLERAR